MSTRGTLLSTLLAVGCHAYTYRPPPGPPIESPPSAPRSVVPRESSPRPLPGSTREVVLDDRDGLSPDEAAILAIDQNPQLKAIRAQRGIGQAQVLAAKILPNPRASGAFIVPVSGPEAQVLGYGAGISWNITPLFSRRARMSSAEASLDAIDLEVAWQEWQVAQTARLHTIRSIYAQRKAEVAGELERTWQERLDALRRAREAQAVTQLEVTNAEHAFAAARVRKLELDQQAVTALADLSRALGVDARARVVVDVSFTTGDHPPEVDTLLEDLPRRRLDLIALQRVHRSHDQAVRAAVAARFPPLQIGAKIGREADNVGSGGLTLAIDIPIFDRNQPAVARERARRTQAEADYDARLLQAQTTVVQLVDEVQVVQEQLQAARDATTAADRLAEEARAAAISGALSPVLAADLLQRAYGTKLRALEIEQRLAELQLAVATTSGTDIDWGPAG